MKMWLWRLCFTTLMDPHSWWIKLRDLLFFNLIFKFIVMEMTQFNLIFMRFPFLMHFNHCLLLVLLISRWMLKNTIFLNDNWVHFGSLLLFWWSLFIKNIRNFMFFMWGRLIKTLTKLWLTGRTCLNWW